MVLSTPGGFANHSRTLPGFRLIYPVLSRRSGGLSVGINLFPDRKLCSFDCPYCEVFPTPEGPPFSLEEFEAELADYLGSWDSRQGPIKDLSFSGDGEPTLSPHVGPALAVAAGLRRRFPEAAGRADLVVITNSTGFLVPEVSALLADFTAREGLVVWAKLDAGEPLSFQRMSGSTFDLADILAGIRRFAHESPLVIQTMVCAVDGQGPTDLEMRAYALALGRLLEGGSRITEVHLYTQARPSPGNRTSALSDSALGAFSTEVAREVAAHLGSGLGLPRIRTFGAKGEVRA